MDLSLLAKKVVILTKDVGEFIRGESQIFDREHIEYKGLHDMVSYVDKTAERDLVRGLSSISIRLTAQQILYTVCLHFASALHFSTRMNSSWA